MILYEFCNPLKVLNKLNSLKIKLIRIFNIIRYINYPRRTTLIPDTFKACSMFSKLDYFLHYFEYRTRIKLMNNYPGADVIDCEIGYGKSKHLQKEEVSSIRAYAKSVEWREDVQGKKKPFLQSINFNYGDIKELDKLITSPKIIGPVAHYLGVFPIFHTATIFYSPNTQNFPGVSQNAHLDNEDVKQIKCWIPLDDITNDSGPLHILPANKSHDLYKKLLKNKKISVRNQKIEDKLISKYVTNKEWIKCTGGVDEIFYTDTCRCYHFGSRKALKPRLVLMLHYASPSSKEVPFFIRKKKKFKTEDLTYLLGFQGQLFTHKYRRNKNR